MQRRKVASSVSKKGRITSCQGRLSGTTWSAHSWASDLFRVVNADWAMRASQALSLMLAGTVCWLSQAVSRWLSVAPSASKAAISAGVRPKPSRV